MAKRTLAILGAAIFLGLTGRYVYTHLEPAPVCEACHRAIHGETYYRVFVEGGEVEHVCCPRCGLRFQDGRTDVTGADASDYNTQERIPVEEAIFVEDSDVVMCRHDNRVEKDLSGGQYALTWDRCLPSLVAFSTREDAETFQRESGGELKTYAELLEEEF